MNDKQINEMVDNVDRIDNEVVAAAKVKRAQEVKARKVEAMTRALDAMAEQTKNAVRALRNAREMERLAKTNLVKVAEAEKQFHTDGDIQKYAEAIFGKGNRQTEYFVRNFTELVNPA